MNGLAAAVLAAGELICQFDDQSVMLYTVRADRAAVIDSHRPGRRPVALREDEEQVHLIERAGPSVRVTSLTACTRTKRRDGHETCTQFAASHAWHFDLFAMHEPATSQKRQPSGAAGGFCEPWRVD